MIQSSMRRVVRIFGVFTVEVTHYTRFFVEAPCRKQCVQEAAARMHALKTCREGAGLGCDAVSKKLEAQARASYLDGRFAASAVMLTFALGFNLADR